MRPLREAQSDLKIMPSPHLITLLFILAVCVSCSTPDQDTHAHGVEATTLTLAISPMVHDRPFSCQESYALGTTQKEVSFTDFKLFVSEVTLLREGGEEIAADIVTEEPWQYEGVALLDLEDDHLWKN